MKGNQLFILYFNILIHLSLSSVMSISETAVNKKQNINNEIIKALEAHSLILKEQNENLRSLLEQSFDQKHFTDFSDEAEFKIEDFSYDIINRFILHNTIENDTFTASAEKESFPYLVINFKSIIKLDNGKFSPFFIIIYWDYKIYCYDIRNNLLSIVETQYIIKQFVNFLTNEENEFNALAETKDKITLVIKYQIDIINKRLISNDKAAESVSDLSNESINCSNQNTNTQSINCNEEPTLFVKTFKDEIDYNNEYELSFHYNKNSKKFKYNIKEIGLIIVNEKQIKFNTESMQNPQILYLSKNCEEEIKLIKTYLSKGKNI